MITLLSNFYIKENMTEDKKRGAYGILCGVAGIILNLILTISKVLAGLISGSISIMADGFNNLSDAGSSIITMLGFKIASAKPDAKHPYGHGRVEYMAGLIVSALILGMSFSLLKESINKIFHPKSMEISLLVIIILVASILVKIYMAFYNHKIGNQINSAAIKATSIDSLTDSIATFVVLISTLINHYFKINIDGYCGVLVALFVGYAGFTSARETLSPLLGEPPNKEFVDKIEEITLNYNDKILGIHDLIVHDYGPGRIYITLHVEMPSNEDVLDLHEITDELEVEIFIKLNCHATVHLDPIVIDDPKVNKLRQKTNNLIIDYDNSFKMHDFRVVLGKHHTNLIFDILVPMDYKKSDDEIKDIVFNLIQEKIGKEYFAVIKIDRDIGFSKK